MSDKPDKGMWWKAKARFPFNGKVMALSDVAFRLHVSTSCWCCDELNDGKFSAGAPAGMPKAPPAKKLPSVIKELVDAGLWKPTEEGGYEIHDFLKYNMSRAQYEAMKAAGKEGGKRSAESRRRRNEPPPSGYPSPAPQAIPARHALAQPRPHPEHDHDHEERSNNPPPKDLTGRARSAAPTAAVEFEFCSRGDEAVLILEDPSLASARKPHQWPELIELVRIGCEATGQEQRLLPYDSDPTVQAFVLLLARYDLAKLRTLLPRVFTTDFWHEKPNRPLSHLSPAVFDRVLADDAELARVEAERQQARQRSTVPRKAPPPPVPAAEILKLAQAGIEAVGG
jgi:hypothetical protein